MSKAIYEWAKGVDDSFMVFKTEYNVTSTVAIVDTEEQAKAVVAALIAAAPARKEGWYALRQDWPSCREISTCRFIDGKWLSDFDDVLSAAGAEALEKNGVWIGDIADEHR